jgi:hypothetical protein
MVTGPERRPGTPVPWLDGVSGVVDDRFGAGTHRVGAPWDDGDFGGDVGHPGGAGGDADDFGAWGDDEGAPGGRRPRVVRVVGFVAAASLLLATVGTTVGVLFGGTSGGTSFPTRVLSVLPELRGRGAATVGAREAVTFTVTNVTGSTVASECAIALTPGHAAEAPVTVDLLLGPGSVDKLTALLPVGTEPFAGSPSDARVRCAGAVTGDAGASGGG